MTALAIIAAARSAGLTLTADGPDLVVRPAARLPPALREQLAAHKPEVLEALRGEIEPPGREPCTDCGRTDWVVSLVVGDDRTCSACALGRSRLPEGVVA